MRQLIADRDYPEAEEMARQLLQKLEAEPGPESLGMATALDLLGEALYRGGEEAEAEPIIRRAISVKEKLLGKNHQEVAISLKHLGNLTSDLDAALGHYRKSLEIFHASVEPNPLEMGRVQLGIGSILRIQGKLEQAELVLAQALATLPNGEWTKDRVKVRLEKGRVLMAQGRYQEAESQGSGALILLEKVGLEETLQFAKGLRLIVQARWRGGRAREDETLEFARRAVRMSEEMLGPESVEYADALIELGNLLQKRGEYADAEDLFKEALQSYEEAQGPRSVGAVTAWHNLGSVREAMGRFEEARANLEQALEIEEELFGTRAPRSGRHSLESGQHNGAIQPPGISPALRTNTRNLQESTGPRASLSSPDPSESGTCPFQPGRLRDRRKTSEKVFADAGEDAGDRSSVDCLESRQPGYPLFDSGGSAGSCLLRKSHYSG